MQLLWCRSDDSRLSTGYSSRPLLSKRCGLAVVHDLGSDLGEVGEYRTLGGFCPVLHGEKVISEGSIQDSRHIKGGRS
jgi:hypothetical protein